MSSEKRSSPWDCPYDRLIHSRYIQWHTGKTAVHMQIIEATIHQLIKQAPSSGPTSVRIHPRKAALPVDGVLRTLCTDLLALYTRSANSTGTLGTDATLHAFPIRLTQYVDAHIDFQSFTTNTVNLIAREMAGQQLANGGYAMFLRYTKSSEDFVLVAMLKLKPGAGIDEATLTLQSTLSIDLNLLHEAARVNITSWRSGREPYLTFIKGRTKGDVTTYFRDSLACQNFTSSSHHTKELIRAADNYVSARTDLSTPEQKSQEKILMRKRLYDCFADNPEEVVLQTLSAAIHPSEPHDFVDWLRSGEQSSAYQVNERFKPDRPTFSRIKRISGRIGASITVGFDVADVHEHRVYYDASLDAIVLNNPPTTLKQAIEENASDERS